MRARLFCPVGELEGSKFEIRGEATLGRGADCTFVLASKAVSSNHARIAFDQEQGHFLLEDLGSLNGTQLDGAPVKGRETLGALHVITLGRKHDFVFQDLGAFPGAFPEALPEEPGVEGTMVDQELPGLPSILAGLPPEPAPPAVVASVREVPGTSQDGPILEGTMVDQELPQLPSIFSLGLPDEAPREVPGTSHEVAGTSHEVAGTSGMGTSEMGASEKGGSEVSEVRFLLEIRALTGEWSRRVLAEGENIVGREVAAQVHIPNASVSRKHAVVTVSGSEVTVRDLGSRNQTFVDDGEVSTTEPVPLAAGAVLRFGNVEATLIVQGSDAAGKGEEIS